MASNQAAQTPASSPVALSRGLLLAKRSYFLFLVAFVLTVAFASFVRERAQLLTDISFWFFVVPFLATLISVRAGLVVGVLMLTISPALHHHLNILGGTELNAWAYAGVETILGFVTAWIVRGGVADTRILLQRFPAGAVLALHAWISISAIVAVGRNIWQSASELTLRGIAYNVWLIRGLSFHDDYFPLQDLFFYSVAVVVVFAAWDAARRYGNRLVSDLAVVVIAGAVFNALFGAWQRASGRGWFAGLPSDINSFWPDIHSFAGLMSMAMVLSGGLLLLGRRQTWQKLTIIGAFIVAALGLFISGSRSTVLLMACLLCVGTVWAATFRLKGWRRSLPVGLLLLLTLATGAVFLHGYRGVSVATIAGAIESRDLSLLNAALSHRPEIWRAALAMYAEFPLFGLGQGAFHRLSSMPGFSSSDVLTSAGGGGAHNYFLHSAVELGPVGVLVAIFIAIPFARLRTLNLRMLSFYALAGIAIGNVYGNSLLVREMLMLAAVFSGSYIWEAQTACAEQWRPPGTVAMRWVSVLVVVMALAGLVEVVRSFDRAPFTYGRRCFEPHYLEPDGWTRGVLKTPVPTAAVAAKVSIKPSQHAMQRRALEVEYWLSYEDGGQILLATQNFQRGDDQARTARLPLGNAGENRFLEIRPSRCFVPLDLGYALDRKHDTRRLGVRVTELQYLDSAGP